ncbi:TPA: glycosyltransferase family 2 protein, partial [Streptococcus agalactiae]|nr:glycosyltransferase family 2 protein [Streptococcus agalactiae]
DFEFPCFEGENFLSEEIMYIYLSKKGYFCPQNRKIYCFDYLEDGLTSNIFKLWRKNFKGTIFSLENSYMYVMSFPNIFDRWWSAIKIKMNIQALKMTTLGVIPTLKSEEAGWKILLGFSYLWKVARFKKSE